MKYLFLICFLLSLNFSFGQSHEHVYSLDTKKDIIISSVGLGLHIVGFSLNPPRPTLAGLNALDESKLWSVDRSAIYNNSQTARKISDVILYSSLSIPFLIYTDVKCRSEGFTIGLMGVEAFLITNGITHITKIAAGRYRPFTYNPEISIDEKLNSGSTLSFFSGHTSATTALSFFGAKVLTDLRPNSKYKWLIWTLGITAPAAIGYLRYEAGKHFFTDVVTGYALGAIVGYMVPAMHLNKNVNMGIGFAGTLDFRITF